MFFVDRIYDSPKDFGNMFTGLFIQINDECITYDHREDSHLMITNVFGNLWEIQCGKVIAKCIDLPDKQIHIGFSYGMFSVVNKDLHFGSE